MKRPNILLFITDGHRADALGCCGNRLADTPNDQRRQRAVARAEQLAKLARAGA